MRLVRSFSSNGHTRRNGSGNGVAGANSRDDVYTHGHHASVISQHQARTASNSARFLLPHLQPKMKVLDVGCGPGSISVGLAQATQPGGYLVALDISKEIVEVAGRALADAGLESSCYECKAGSVYDLSSYEDSYFDVAFAHQVLQHLSAPVEALVELKRVVKPGGVIAIRDADYSSMLGYPNLRGIDRWRELYRETARRNNAQPDAGRYLVSWGRQAGFEEIQFTTSVMVCIVSLNCFRGVPP